MIELIRGQKLKLADAFNNPSFDNQSGIAQSLFYITIDLKSANLSCDIASFGLDGEYRLSDERYMTFYNQPQTPCQGIQLIKTTDNQATFSIDLSRLDRKIETIVWTAAIDGSGSMSGLSPSVVSLSNAQQQTVAQLKLEGQWFAQERALMLVELYRKNDIWRLAAVAQGFSDGLPALIRHFGGEVADDQPAAASSTASTSTAASTKSEASKPASVSPESTSSVAQPSRIDLKKQISLQKAERTGQQSIIDLTKKSLIALEKKNLLEVSARVALVLDASGSMDNQYKRGDVQKVVDRLMPLAINFDNDGSFECWAFAQKTTRLDDVTLDNVGDFINTSQRGWRNWAVGARYNEEIPAIEAVIDYYRQFKDGVPVYVLFISDGGVGNARQMQRLLSDAAKLPLFWQFVGIGGRNYGVLEKLDDLTGRIVDNCNFFALDQITSISDEELYSLLLEEFPDWLSAARRQRIVA